MDIQRLEIPDVVVMVPERHGDHRGHFCEVFNEARFIEACGAHRFVQDNEAFSAAKGTLRGLHFQMPPMAQAKLIRVLQGSILDVAVDLRAGSPSFGRHVRAKLSAENRTQLFIPAGFAHGYCTLEADTAVFYKVDNYYSPEHDRGIAWNDPALAIAWPGIDETQLSAKDRQHPPLNELPQYFG